MSGLNLALWTAAAFFAGMLATVTLVRWELRRLLFTLVKMQALDRNMQATLEALQASRQGMQAQRRDGIYTRDGDAIG